MQRPLDPFRFKENRYERPNQDWVCGHAAEGRGCPLGPDARGGCRNTGECIPARKGERWFCMRSDAAGGKCAEGPLPEGACAHLIPPCQPVPSVRRSRAMYVWLTFLVTAGLLLIAFGQHFRRAWMDPGTLTNAHATSATKCSDCHSLDSAGAVQLVSASLGRSARNDSALCLKCHQVGEQPLHPHGLAPARLKELQRQLPRPNESKRTPILLRASHALAARDAHGNELACATCHKEHHGPTFDLTRLSDAQCQACHSDQFTSFEKGHPEFSGYPAQRRTRIFFDHNSHIGPKKHFAEMKGKAPTGCQSCHVPGAAGRFMQVKNFNASCASCHSDQIKGEGMTVKGVAFFTVPGIDVETLAAKGISVGEWPKFADQKITPFMEMLFDRQPEMHSALARLQGVDLLDLTKATPEQLAAAEQFAWGVKTLLFHLVVEGQSYLLKEMKGEIAPVGLEVPRGTLLAAQEEWMPKLLAEVTAYQKGVKPPVPEKSLPAAPAASQSPSAKPAGTGASPSADGDLLAAPVEATPASSNATSGDLLVGESDDLAAATPTPTPAAKESDDLTGGDLLSADLNATPSPVPVPATTQPAMPAEEWVAAGGWYRPQESFTLFYRPMGHADPLLVAWLNTAASLENEGAAATPGALNAFQKLTDPQTPGLCMKCHTIEKNGQATVVNWSPAHPNSKSRPFTTFSHTTHFSLVGDAGCQTCHALDSKSQYAKFFSGENGAAAAHDATKFQSNFAPISKMLCAECHQPRVAGDGCVLCHRYHAGRAAGEVVEIGRFRSSLNTKLVPDDN